MSIFETVDRRWASYIHSRYVYIVPQPYHIYGIEVADAFSFKFFFMRHLHLVCPCLKYTVENIVTAATSQTLNFRNCVYVATRKLIPKTTQLRTTSWSCYGTSTAELLCRACFSYVLAGQKPPSCNEIRAPLIGSSVNVKNRRVSRWGVIVQITLVFSWSPR